MATIAEIRAKYPQYQDMSDEDLAGAMHRKFYADMPIEEFHAKVGLATPASELSALTQKFDADPTEVRAQMRANQMEEFGGQAGAGELFGNSFVLGLKDKVAGLAGAASGLFDGNGVRQGYNVGRRAQEIVEDRARERSGNLGKVAEVAGAVGTGTLARAPAAASAIGRVLQTGREAGTLGLIQGVGDTQADTLGGMAGDALMSGGTSAALGGAIGAGIEVGRGLFNAGRAMARGVGSLLDDTQGRAERKIVKALSDDNVTPAQAAARMRNRGTALINAGDENLLGLGRAASAKPGPGRTTLNRALDAQQRNSQQQVLAAVDQTLGGRDIPLNRRVAQMVTQRSQNGERMYESAFRRNFERGHSPRFDALQQRVPGEAVRNAQRIAQAEGRAFGEQLIANIDDAGNVTFRRAPSLREWHYIQRGLRSATDTAYRAGVGEVGTAYRNLHRELLDAMDEASPAYRAARRVYSSQSEMLDAIRRGREILAPASTRNVDALVDDIAGMSAGEREMMRIGLARQMQDMLEATPDAAGDMVKKIFGNQAKRSAIRATFDNDRAFRAFETRMRQLAKEAKSFQFVRTGSRTSFVDAEKDAVGVMADAATGAVDVATTGGLNSTIRGAAKLLKDMGGMDEEVAAEVARILIQRDPNTVVRALSQSARRVNNQAARDALLARAAPIARALSVGGSVTGGRQAVTVR